MVERLPKLNLLTGYSKEKNTLLNYWTLLYYNKYLYYFFNFFLKRGKKMISIKLIYLLLQKIKEYTMLPPVLVLQGALLNYRHLLKLRVLKYRRKSIYKYIFLSPEKQIKMSINYLAQRFSSFNLPGVQYGALDRLTVFVLNLFFKTSLVYGRFLSNNIHMYTLINESKRKGKRSKKSKKRKKLKKHDARVKKKRSKGKPYIRVLNKKRRLIRKKKISRLKRKLIFTLKRRLFKKRRRKKFRFKKMRLIRLKRRITKFYRNHIHIKETQRRRIQMRARTKKLFLHLLRRSLIQWFRWTRLTQELRKNHISALLKKNSVLKKKISSNQSNVIVSYLNACINNQASCLVASVHKNTFIKSTNYLYSYLFIFHVYTHYVLRMDQMNLVFFFNKMLMNRKLRRLVLRTFYLFLARTRFINNYIRLSNIRKDFLRRRRVLSYRLLLLSKLCRYLKTDAGLKAFRELSLSMDDLLSSINNLQSQYKKLFNVFQKGKRFSLLTNITKKYNKRSKKMKKKIRGMRKKIAIRVKKENRLNLYVKRLNATISLRRLNRNKVLGRRFFIFSKLQNVKIKNKLNKKKKATSHKLKKSRKIPYMFSMLTRTSRTKKKYLNRLLVKTCLFYKKLDNSLPLHFSSNYLKKQVRMVRRIRYLGKKFFKSLRSVVQSKNNVAIKRTFTKRYYNKTKQTTKNKLKYKFFSNKKSSLRYIYNVKMFSKLFNKTLYSSNYKELLESKEKIHRGKIISRLNHLAVFPLTKKLDQKVKNMFTKGERNHTQNKKKKIVKANMLSNKQKTNIKIVKKDPLTKNFMVRKLRETIFDSSNDKKEIVSIRHSNTGVKRPVGFGFNLGFNNLYKDTHKINTNRIGNSSLITVTKRHKITYIFSDGKNTQGATQRNKYYKKPYVKEPQRNPFEAIIEELQKSIPKNTKSSSSTSQRIVPQGLQNKNKFGSSGRYTWSKEDLSKKIIYKWSNDNRSRHGKYDPIDSKEEVLRQVRSISREADSLLRELNKSKTWQKSLSNGMNGRRRALSRARKVINRLKENKDYKQLREIRSFVLLKKKENNYIFKIKQLMTRGIILGLYTRNKKVLNSLGEQNSIYTFSPMKINGLETHKVNPHLFVLHNYMENIDTSYQNLKSKISTLVKRINIRFEIKNQLRFKYRHNVLPVSIRTLKKKIQERYSKLFKTAAMKKSLKHKKTHLSDFDYLLGLYELYQDHSIGYKPELMGIIKTNKTSLVNSRSLIFYKKLILHIIFKKIYRMLERVYKKITLPFWHLFMIRAHLLTSLVTSKFHSKVEIKSVDDSFLSNLIYYLNSKKTYVEAPIDHISINTRYNYSPQNTFLNLYEQRNNMGNMLLRMLDETVKKVTLESNEDTRTTSEKEMSAVDTGNESNFYLEHIERKVHPKNKSKKLLPISFKKKFSYLSSINTEKSMVSLFKKQKEKLLSFVYRFNILRNNRLRRLNKHNLLSCISKIRKYYFYLLRFKLIKVVWFALNFNMRRKNSYRRLHVSRVSTNTRFMLKNK